MKKLLLTALCFVALATTTPVYASIITFDELVQGATSYSYDGDHNGQADAIFSTTDTSGFNTAGPGPQMAYINEPGLEGTSLLNPDLRVDFVVGAKNSLGFGFALDSGSENSDTWANFGVYDSSNNLLASTTQYGTYTLVNGYDSSFPEGNITVNFSGIASYALFDFSSDYGRYIIDDFQGTYGQTEVPEPATLLLLGSGLAGLGLFRRKVKKA